MAISANSQALCDTDGTPEERPRLLIVDDIADNRELLSRRFRQRGFATVEAADGFAALDLINGQTFDVVLLDVMMPGIDGLETLKRIRTVASATELPVIMVTAKSQSEDIVQALQFGASDYVTKPVDFPVALARVTAQVERRKAEALLRSANEALLNAKASLENRVAERTAKLVEANDQLRLEIEKQRTFEERIAYLAHHDSLTGLANRAMFDEQLHCHARTARESHAGLAMLFIDLDGFKAINDMLGHAVGDALLKQIGGMLPQIADKTDFIARLGGDEFGILHLFNGTASSPAALAAHVIDQIASIKWIDGHAISISASIGIAYDDDTGEDIGILPKKADLAMYRAKSEGRGVYRFFSPQMEAELRRRRKAEADLRLAIAANEFELYYQPIYSLLEDRLTGFEALLRWQHFERGMIPPVEFIALAEETGLIIPLGDWVICRACEEAARWPGTLKVAVNLSPVQFRSKNLVDVVIQALGDSGLQPDRLELEVTESVLLADNDVNLATLQRLRETGVRISMDDFGTGYSGLSYLKAFRFDKVKIDQSFIRDMGDQEASRAIVRAVAGLGTSFGIATTAEGVETSAQLDYLRLEGCTEIQGYLLGRPQPASQIPEIIHRLSQDAHAARTVIIVKD